MRSLLVAAALTTGAFLVGSGVAKADSTVIVNPASLGTNWYTSDTRTPGTTSFVFGPATAPLGSGSAEFRTPHAGGSNDGAAKAQLFTSLYNGTRLDAIQGIGYSTYMQNAEVPFVAMAALNMRVALDGGATPGSYMTYEPYQDLGNSAITAMTWQTWDAYRGGSAKWWVNTGITVGPDTLCTQSVPCTWNQILSYRPNATIREGASCGSGGVVSPCPGSLGINQGSGNAGAISNADKFYVRKNDDTTTYNFEPTADTTPPSCGSMVVRRGAGPDGADQADVTVTDSGSGIKEITNFTVTNGTSFVEPFSPGAASVKATATKTTAGVSTHFAFDVTDMAGNTTHCV